MVIVAGERIDRLSRAALSTWPIAAGTSPTSSPAANSSASPSRVHWWQIRRCSSATSRRAMWIDALFRGERKGHSIKKTGRVARSSVGVALGKSIEKVSVGGHRVTAGERHAGRKEPLRRPSRRFDLALRE
jgi:hypothetical protein